MPPAGLEPASAALEAVALTIELEGLVSKKAAKAANIATDHPVAIWQPWQPWRLNSP